MTDVLTIGETLLALRTMKPIRVGEAATLSFVGAETNMAIGLARLGHKVAWLGVLGSDPLSVQVRRTLIGEGVDCGYVRECSKRSTGLVLFDSPMEGVRRVSYFRRDSAGAQLSHLDLQAITSIRPRLVHITGITSALSDSLAKTMRAAVSLARAQGSVISFDINHRASLWPDQLAHRELKWLLQNSDIVFGSVDELKLAFGTSVEDGIRAHPGVEFVVKRGAAGATVHVNGEVRSVPWEPRSVVDPVGSGDGFAAGYVSAWLEERSFEERLERAHMVAKFVVSNTGDWEGLPLRRELHLAAQADDVIR